MVRENAFDGKLHAGNPLVRLDRGIIASSATPRRGSLLRGAKLVVGVMVGLVCTAQAAEQYADRWFYVARGLGRDQDVQEIRELADVAGKNGLNGMLLCCGVESYDYWDEATRARLESVKRACEVSRIEIIPIIWSVGYGTMLNKNKNLVEGIPCRDIPYHALGKTAEIVATPSVEFANPGFESPAGAKAGIPGWSWTDRPGDVSHLDAEVRRSGKYSLRLQNFENYPHGHGRACHALRLKLDHPYLLSAWVKTENFTSADGHGLKIQVYSRRGSQAKLYAHRGEMAQLAMYSMDEKQPTRDWTKISVVCSLHDDPECLLYVGVWGGKSGKVWIDDVMIEEFGVTDVIRRPGTPFTVRNAKTGAKYEEGRDFAPVPGLRQLNPREDKRSLVLQIPEGSAIREGDDLLIDYYRPSWPAHFQNTVCMSEPELYERFARSAQAIRKALNPKKWFLSMDEIRAGGTCAACEARKTDMAHILADCICKQREIIRKTCPGAEIYIWSDMLDPAHNAHDNYYLCKGTYEGVWDLIPNDLIIACWYRERRNLSMPFFSKRGFRTLAGAYYDVDTLDGCAEWLQTCNETPRCTGIMYTSWRNKYRLLGDFGKLIREKSAPLR
ncbi:MAG: hypothetical protein IJR99_07690 [Kiritimatiellae bacterium]|nr:hypothetical protein [Kiritimatiellia bacterium]